jgi:hypothetical protein
MTQMPHIPIGDTAPDKKARKKSQNETSRIASYRYKSTLAIMFLTEILENAVETGIEKPKKNNENQKRNPQRIQQ